MENDTQLPACGALGGSTFLSAEGGTRRCQRVCVTQMGKERQDEDGRYQDDEEMKEKREEDLLIIGSAPFLIAHN